MARRWRPVHADWPGYDSDPIFGANPTFPMIRPCTIPTHPNPLAIKSGASCHSIRRDAHQTPTKHTHQQQKIQQHRNILGRGHSITRARTNRHIHRLSAYARAHHYNGASPAGRPQPLRCRCGTRGRGNVSAPAPMQHRCVYLRAAAAPLWSRPVRAGIPNGRMATRRPVTACVECCPGNASMEHGADNTGERRKHYF